MLDEGPARARTKGSVNCPGVSYSAVSCLSASMSGSDAMYTITNDDQCPCLVDAEMKPVLIVPGIGTHGEHRLQHGLGRMQTRMQMQIAMRCDAMHDCVAHS